MSSPSPSPRETGGKAQGTSSLQSPGDGGKRSRRKLVPLPQGDRSSWPGSVGDGSQYGNDASDEPTGSASQSREMLLNESHDNGSSPLPMDRPPPSAPLLDGGSPAKPSQDGSAYNDAPRSDRDGGGTHASPGKIPKEDTDNTLPGQGGGAVNGGTQSGRNGGGSFASQDKLQDREDTHNTQVGNRVGESMEFQAPSDEEIKEFCLATGGGFGSVDPTEKTFFIGYPRFRLEHHQGTGGSRLVPVLRQAFKRGTKVTNQDARTEHKIGARLAPLVRNDGKNTSRPVAAGDVNAFGTMVLAIGLPSSWKFEKVDVTLQASRDCPRTMINADDVWIRDLSPQDPMKKDPKEKHEWSTRSHFVPDPEIPRGTPEGSSPSIIWKKLEKEKIEHSREIIKLKNLKTLDDNLKKACTGARRRLTDSHPDEALAGRRELYLQISIINSTHIAGDSQVDGSEVTMSKRLEKERDLREQWSKKLSDKDEIKVTVSADLDSVTTSVKILERLWGGALQEENQPNTNDPKDTNSTTKANEDSMGSRRGTATNLPANKGNDGSRKTTQCLIPATDFKGKDEKMKYIDANTGQEIESDASDDNDSPWLKCYFKAKVWDWDLQYLRDLDPYLEDKQVVAAGRLTWETKWQEDRAPYVRVPTPPGPCQGDTGPCAGKTCVKCRRTEGWGMHTTNPHLLRFMLEHVWEVTRPKLIITVTGGAQDFHLPTKRMELLMQGLTEAAKTMDAWFFSGGSDVGIMKHIGEARAKYSIKTPLIGIASWGIVKGRHMMVEYEKALKDMEDLLKRKDKEGNFQALDDKEGNFQALNHNHSHFIFAHDGSTGEFGKETVALRGHLEACMAHSRNAAACILESLERQGLGWQGLNMKSAHSASKRKSSAIPAVCVCVEGGPGTIATVYHAVKNLTPVLLVRGSGRAANLLSDAVLAVNGKNDPSAAVRGVTEAAKDFEELLELLSWSLQRAEHQSVAKASDDLYQRAQDLWKKYHLGDKPVEDVVKHLKQVGECAGLKEIDDYARSIERDSNKWCTVFDLDGDDADAFALNGAMLECIIRGLTSRERASSPWDGEAVSQFLKPRVERTLKLVVSWNREDKLRQQLQIFLIEEDWNRLKHNKEFFHGNEDKKKEDKAIRSIQKARDMIRKQMRIALVEALGFGFTKIVECLIEFGAGLDILRINQIELWEILPKLEGGSQISRAKTNQNSLSSSPTPEHECIKAAEQWRNLVDIVEHEEGQEAMVFQKVMKRAAKQLEKETKQLEKETEADDKLRQLRDFKVKNLAREYENIKCITEMDLALVDLLGDDFRFNIGLLGPTWDLLLISAMLGRQELAIFMWGQCRYPITAALTVCCIHHEMAQKYTDDPDERSELERKKKEFEELAIRVYHETYRENPRMALDGLEAPIGVWNSRTAFDVAFKADCRRFIHSCCLEASNARWAGDLDPHQRWRGLWLDAKVFLCIVPGCFFIAPWFLKFSNPPIAKTLTAPAQRREIPPGYPSMPFSNPTLRELFQKEEGKAEEENEERGNAEQQKKEEKESNLAWQEGPKWFVIMKKLQEEPARAAMLSPAELSDLWEPTFTYWKKFWCFLQAPVTIFMVNSIFFLTIVVLLTDFVRRSGYPVEEQPSYMPYMEDVLASYAVASFLNECLQVYEDGPIEYISDLWNWIDVASLSLFWAGRAVQIFCDSNGECWKLTSWETPSATKFYNGTSISEVSESEDVAFLLQQDTFMGERGISLDKTPRQLYGWSCLFFWIRLLHLYSVNEELGPLVLAIRRMGKPIRTFLFIIVVMLIGFSVTIDAGQTQTECLDKSDPQALHAFCMSEMWWILRTYFQSFGEMFLDTVDDDWSVYATVMALLVLQLILMNTVFVAMITSTYEETLSRSREEWMMDMYKVTDSYMDTWYALPVPIAPIITRPIIEIKKYLKRKELEESGKLEKEALLRPTPLFKLKRRYVNPRYSSFKILPPELKQQITQRRRTGELENMREEELKKYRRRIYEEDTHTLQKWQAVMQCEALQQRSQARVIRSRHLQKEVELQSEKRFLRLDDKVDEVYRMLSTLYAQRTTTKLTNADAEIEEDAHP